MNGIASDIRYALRMVRVSPGFTIAVVATLALVIGTNAATFAVVNRLILTPVPYPSPDRLVLFMHVSRNATGPGVSETKFNVWKQVGTAFEDVSAFVFGTANVTEGEPEQVPIARVSADFFRLFGVPFAHGRGFAFDEDVRGGSPTAVISAGLWRRRFNGDPAAAGQTIAINGEPHRIVGILGEFDTEPLQPFTGPPDIWLPLRIDVQSKDQGNNLFAAGRLKDGVPLDDGKRQLGFVAEEFKRQFPGVIRGEDTFTAEPLQAVMVRDAKPLLQVLTVAVGLVLLIACGNLANLFLVRASVRTREIATRCAIGASRRRVARQLLTETLLYSSVGGVLGLWLATRAFRVLLTLFPENLLRISSSAVVIDWRVLAFTAALSTGTALLFGCTAAFRINQVDLTDALKSGAVRSSDSHARGRRFLVSLQVALALVLLVGALLLLRTLRHLYDVEPGFETRNIITARMSLIDSRFATTAASDRLVREGVEQLQALPGVVAASASCCLPLENDLTLRFLIEGRAVEGAYQGMAAWRLVSPSYFAVFRIPLLRGRLLDDRDVHGGAGVVVISESMAKQYWPDADPLQGSLVIGRGQGPAFEEPARRIIGIVGDVRDGRLDRQPRATMYVPLSQLPDGVTAMNARLLPLAWAIRVTGAPEPYAMQMSKLLEGASGGLPISNVRTMTTIVARSTSRASFNSLILSGFAGTAALLAAIGIYGVVAYAVQQRTREIGIRLALGAESYDVRRMILRQSVGPIAAGLAVGVILAGALTRYLQSQLFGVTALDVVTFTSAALVLGLIAIVAAWMPAHRAGRVSPQTALKAE